jgi:hypothetical protein
VRLEGLGQLKNPVPQPTTLPRAPGMKRRPEKVFETICRAYIFFSLMCLNESRPTYFSVTLFSIDLDIYKVEACYVSEIRATLRNRIVLKGLRFENVK